MCARRIFLALPFVAFLSICSCVNRDPAMDKTLVTLRRVDLALSQCRMSSEPPTSNADCISKIASARSVDRRMYTLDWYGGVIVLDQSQECSGKKFISPYSTGPNRTDECGEGDDFGVDWP